MRTQHARVGGVLCTPTSPSDTSDTSFRTVRTAAAPTPPPAPLHYTWPVPRGAHHPKDDSALEQRKSHILDSDDPTATLWRGVAEALWQLLETVSSKTPKPPPVLDEHRLPLCADDSPLVSVQWTAAEAPRKSDSRRFVFAMLDGLQMSPRCAVTAIVLLEMLIRTRRDVFCPRSARPLVVACCVLALKLTWDAEVLTNAVFEPLEDLLTGIGPVECARMEKQVLNLLDWRVPNDPKLYELYARELVYIGLRPGQAFDPAAVPPMF